MIEEIVYDVMDRRTKETDKLIRKMASETNNRYLIFVWNYDTTRHTDVLSYRLCDDFCVLQEHGKNFIDLNTVRERIANE